MSEKKEQKLTYLQMISVDKEAAKKDELAVKAQEVSLGISKSILEVKQKLSKVNSDIEKLKSMYPYDYEAEYGALQVKFDLERKLDFLNEIKEERFHDSKI